MRDVYKNPLFYYVLVPVVIGLWPLLLWRVYLPRTQEGWANDQAQYMDAGTYVDMILDLDPERLDIADANSVTEEFDYAIAVDRVANLCRIPTGNYRLQAGRVLTTGGQKSETAKVTLSGVDIHRVARFLSTIQSVWTSLQCDKVKLTAKPGVRDRWDIELDFKYFY